HGTRWSDRVRRLTPPGPRTHSGADRPPRIAARWSPGSRVRTATPPMTSKTKPERETSSARARAGQLGARIRQACGLPPAAPPPEILSTVDVLSGEYNAIWGGHGRFPSEDAYYQAVHARDQAALCLSGGGIRSAAFALGALQALASRGLLTRFHYLSTVS